MPIDRLVVSNFKSYAGQQVVGPFRTFTAVIGPNGSGKSNLMDAVSFVLGVRTAQLRGAQLRDLIHSPDAQGRSPSKKTNTYVEIVYVDDESSEEESKGRELRFRRSINASGSSQYFVNGKAMSWDQYVEELKKINVLVKARNFLVFQGDVEAIAQKNPKELTELFETISGSAELKERYETCKDAAEKAEELCQLSFEKKKGLQKEEKQIREQKEEADQYQELQDQLKEVKLKFFLWQLFHLQKDLDAHLEELDKKSGAGAEEGRSGSD